MVRKALTLTAIMLVFSACELQAEVVHSTWAGGESGYWDDDTNWDPPITPHNSASQKFLVTIDSNSIGVEKIQIHLAGSPASIPPGGTFYPDVNQIDCYGTVELARSSTLTLVDANGLTNHGELRIYDGLEIQGNVNNSGDMGVDGLEVHGNVVNFSGARFGFEEGVICGNLYNAARGDMQLDEHVSVREGEIQNEGYMLITPSGELWAEYGFDNSGEILMYLAECSTLGIFENASTGEIRGAGAIHSDQAIQNQGAIYALGGGLVLHTYGSVINTGILGNRSGSTLHIMPSVGDVSNRGTIRVNSHGSVTADCNLVNEPNGVIQLHGGTLEAPTITQTADANFAGFGGITGDVVIDPNGLIELTGPTNIVGDVEIGSNATLEVSDGTTLITGHTTCNNGTIHMIGGRVICQGGLTNNNCNIIWEPGTYTNIADFNLDGTVNFKDFADFANTWLWQAGWY